MNDFQLSLRVPQENRVACIVPRFYQTGNHEFLEITHKLPKVSRTSI